MTKATLIPPESEVKTRRKFNVEIDCTDWSDYELRLMAKEMKKQASSFGWVNDICNLILCENK